MPPIVHHFQTVLPGPTDGANIGRHRPRLSIPEAQPALRCECPVGQPESSPFSHDDMPLLRTAHQSNVEEQGTAIEDGVKPRVKGQGSSREAIPHPWPACQHRAFFPPIRV